MSVQQTAATSSPSKRPVNFFVCLTAATAALAGLLFGFDAGVISGAILFIKGDFGLTPFTEELLVSAALLGAVCGAALSGRIADARGRKRTLFGTACLFAVGSILCAVVSFTFLSLLHRLGSVSTFLLYAVLSLAGLWFCFCFVPETKGVALERIERDLRAGRPLRELGKNPSILATAP